MPAQDEYLQLAREGIRADLASGTPHDSVRDQLHLMEGQVVALSPNGDRQHQWDSATADRVADLRFLQGEVTLDALADPRLAGPNPNAEKARRAKLTAALGSMAVGRMVQVGSDLERTSTSSGRGQGQGRRDRSAAHYFRARGHELIARASTLDLAQAAQAAHPRVPALRSAVSRGRAAYETAYHHARYVRGAPGAMARAEIAALAVRHERVGRQVAFGRFHRSASERAGTLVERAQSRFESMHWGARRLMASVRVVLNPEARRATHRVSAQYGRDRDPRAAVTRHP